MQPEVQGTAPIQHNLRHCSLSPEPYIYILHTLYIYIYIYIYVLDFIDVRCDAIEDEILVESIVLWTNMLVV